MEAYLCRTTGSSLNLVGLRGILKKFGYSHKRIPYSKREYQEEGRGKREAEEGIPRNNECVFIREVDIFG